MPDTIPVARQALIRAEWLNVIGQDILPAYGRLRRFLAEDYLPSARSEPGLAAMKGGTSQKVSWPRL